MVGGDHSIVSEPSEGSSEYTGDEEYTEDEEESSSFYDDEESEGKALSVFSRRGRGLGGYGGPMHSYNNYMNSTGFGTGYNNQGYNGGMSNPSNGYGGSNTPAYGGYRHITPNKPNTRNYANNPYLDNTQNKNLSRTAPRRNNNFYSTPSRNNDAYRGYYNRTGISSNYYGSKEVMPFNIGSQAPTGGESRRTGSGMIPANLDHSLYEGLNSGRTRFVPKTHYSKKTFYEKIKSGNYFANHRQWNEWKKHAADELKIVRMVQNMIRGQQFTGRQVYLPGNNNHKKFTLLLDMDETLIHSEEYRQGAPYDMSIELMAPTGRAERIGVYIRPYCLEFLRRMSQKFELGIFTAGKQQYADKIIEKLDPNHVLLPIRLYRHNCSNANGNFIKDFRVIANRRREDIMLVDNLIYSFAADLGNGIPIRPYLMGKDDFELEYLADLLEMLQPQDSVSEFLDYHFKFSNFYKAL